MLILLIILAIGAAVGTFIENDFGSAVAKKLVYNNFWYLLTFLLASINLILIIHKTKMYLVKARAVFHFSFILILIGASVTHYLGLEGSIHIREGEKNNIIIVNGEHIEIPFYIMLKDFKLTRYPGSRSPSEFSSDVTIVDIENNESFNKHISMNNPLTYAGYKFFQTSYDTDEMGTVLSVNKDPGVEITYFGYALLFLGLILNFFDKKSRFQYLLRRIKKTNTVSILFIFFILLTPKLSFAQEYSQFIDIYLTDLRENSKRLSDAFGSLIVQAPDGRMKPLDTQNREVLNKLTGKSTWSGMSANQVILGIFSRPNIWKKVNIIKVKTPKLRKLLGVDENQKLVKFSNFIDEKGDYKLATEVERANILVPSQRGTYERDLIAVDERLNILFMSIRGVLLTIFPMPNNEQNKWVDFKTMFTSIDNSNIKKSARRLLDAAYNRNFDDGVSNITEIKQFQYEFGSSIIPKQSKLDIEIIYNKTNIFIKLSIVYLIFGFILFIYGLISILNNKLTNTKINSFISSIAILLTIIHIVGIAVRWYIGGFAPISNTYETMIFIALSAVIAGVFFFRKSTIALAAAFMLAGVFLFAAYLGEIDPEITNLVPVLKSYWLSIHVSVITASYGFFGVGAMLGITTLILFMLRNKKQSHIDLHIENIRNINEVSLIIGLTLLIIGNFLGAIWANESWGRYWGWDPKETWAYVSILAYTIVLHIRLLKKIYSTYLFTILSIISFFSILMTYYGVNYYLTGLHSYATGDPIPIPSWVYWMVGIILLLIISSYPKLSLKSLLQLYKREKK